jgi:hypothetical protein
MFETGKRRSLTCRGDDTINVTLLRGMAQAEYFTCLCRLDLNFEEKSIVNAFTLDDLARVFHFSPKLTRLSIQMNVYYQNDVNMKHFRELVSQLREGFRKLECMDLTNCLQPLFLSSWPIYQEILT